MKKTFLILLNLLFLLILNFEPISYNLGNYLYKEKNYLQAINFYSFINFNKEIKFMSNYNIWNSYYRLSELEKSKEDELLKKALESYYEALKIKKDDKETIENIAYILNKKLDKKQEDESQSEEKENDENKLQEKSWSWGAKESQNEEKTWSWKTEENQSQEKAWSWSTEKKEIWENKLDSESLKQLDNYEKALLEQQSENIDNFWKQFYDEILDYNWKDW